VQIFHNCFIRVIRAIRGNNNMNICPLMKKILLIFIVASVALSFTRIKHKPYYLSSVIQRLKMVMVAEKMDR
jgi:hypothetical protein